MGPAGAGIGEYQAVPEIAEIPPLPVNYVNQLVEEKFGVFLGRMGLEYPGLLSDFMLASMSDSSQGRFLKTVSSPGFPVDAKLNRMLALGSFPLSRPPPARASRGNVEHPGAQAGSEARASGGAGGVATGAAGTGGAPGVPTEPSAAPSTAPSVAPSSASSAPSGAPPSAPREGLPGAEGHMPHRRALIRFARLTKSAARAPAPPKPEPRPDNAPRPARARGEQDTAVPLSTQAAAADQAWSVSQVSYEHLGDFVYSNNTARSQASTMPLASSSCSSSRPCNPGVLPPRGFYDLEVVISVNPDLVEPGAICPLFFNLVRQALARVLSFFDPTGSSSFIRQSLETRSPSTIYIASPNAVIHPCAEREAAGPEGAPAGPGEPGRARQRVRAQRAPQGVPDYGFIENTTIPEVNPILVWHAILAALRLEMGQLVCYRQLRSLLGVVLQCSSYPDEFLLMHMLPAYFPRGEADVMFSTAWAVFDGSGRYLIGRGAAGTGDAPGASGAAPAAPSASTTPAASAAPAAPQPAPAMDVDTFLRSSCNGRLLRASDALSGCFTSSLTKTSNQIVLYRSAPGRDSRFSERLLETISDADLREASRSGIVVSLSAPLSTAMPAYGVFANKIDKKRPGRTVDALYWLVRLVGLYSGGPFLLVWFCGWPDALKELPGLVEGFPVSFFDRIRLVVVGAPPGTRQAVLRSFLGGTLLAKGYSEKTLRELYQDYPHLVFGAQVSEWNRTEGKGQA